jgi:hypothetical protein
MPVPKTGARSRVVVVPPDQQRRSPGYTPPGLPTNEVTYRSNRGEDTAPHLRLAGRIRRRGRLRWTARKIDPVAAEAAFWNFADVDEPVEIVIGRLLLLLDEHGLFDEVT